MEFLPTSLLRIELGNLEVFIATVFLPKSFRLFHIYFRAFFRLSFFSVVRISFPLLLSYLQAAQNHQGEEVLSYHFFLHVH